MNNPPAIPYSVACNGLQIEYCAVVQVIYQLACSGASLSAIFDSWRYVFPETCHFVL
jgi:hypothetical protein